MAQSIESIVTGLVLLIAAVVIVASHYQREHRRERWLGRTSGHRLWDRVRHRH
ncbi:hypothetical protein [Paraburkholderia sp. NMBU_R16]|uniref:hypothetical protein n=1 Tax=Paraburkholderia sp. NMBU_R16 TaxID=2698676 RepID=UPI001567548A|nr:hypothetical protein [Paraburkholderia sp. NMBU_R16]